MKKIAINLLVITTALFSLYAGDFGVTLDTSIAYMQAINEETSSENLTLSEKAALWGNAAFNDHWTGEFQGSYTYSNSREFTLELDQLQLTGNYIIPGKSGATPLTINAGRLSFSDFSGKVFAHTGDGFKLSWGFPEITYSAFGAYTGFLQQPSSSILMSLADITDLAVDPIPMFGPLASPRVIGGMTITLPELFSEQTLMLSGLSQQDLREEGILKTSYVGFGMMGPLPVISSLFYNIFGYGNSGTYTENRILAYLTGASVNYFMPLFYSSRIVLDFSYASGDADHTDFYEGNTEGLSTMFVPITPAPVGIVFTPQQSNLFHISGAFSLKPFVKRNISPLENTLLMIKPIVFFRSTSGPISTGEILADADPNKLYLGTEVDAVLMARFLSDLGLSIGSGMFFPSPIMENNNPQIKSSIALSLSL